VKKLTAPLTLFSPARGEKKEDERKGDFNMQPLTLYSLPHGVEREEKEFLKMLPPH
jgi:hypothetical protein